MAYRHGVMEEQLSESYIDLSYEWALKHHQIKLGD